MIALPQRLPHVIWKNDRLVPLSEGWLAESIEYAAAAAGHPRWYLAPEVARAIAVYLEDDWVAPALPLDHLITGISGGLVAHHGGISSHLTALWVLGIWALVGSVLPPTI